jgi:glycosyltransferase involved in cell wall biosynthesis
LVNWFTQVRYKNDLSEFRRLLAKEATLDAVSGRVVLVCGSLQPGGAERQVVNTLLSLKSAPIESVTLLCDHLSPGTKECYDFYLPELQQADIVVRLVGEAQSAAEPLPDAFAQTKILPSLRDDVANYYRAFRRLRPEVVHAWLDWSNSRAGLAAVLAGVPRVILSGRNLSPRHFCLDQDYYRPVYQALASKPQIRIINNSLAGAKDYAQWIGIDPSRITVLRNGVDFARRDRPSPEQSAEFRNRLGIPADAPVIGGMFRFNQEKRPFLWLEATAHIRSRLPDAWFVLFGQGPMSADIMATARPLGLDGRLVMPGVVTPSLLGLSVCDVLLLTSSGEGTPNVLLEAQWLGLPVVTTDAGGAAEAIVQGTTGLVARNDSPIEIGECVVRVMTDPEFRQIARVEGPAFIKTRYAIGRMIDETRSIYGQT